MTQYLMSVMHDAEYVVDFTTEEAQRQWAQVGKLNEDMIAAGVWVFAGGLQPASSATVLRTNPNGTVAMTDGPYIESKESIGGFWVIEAPDLDSALEWAGKATTACERPIELRPFQSIDEADAPAR